MSFKVHQRGQVDLETDRPTLAAYLRNHSEWVGHCFKPLKVDPLELAPLLALNPECEKGQCYRLQFFRIGGLGFEVEPCFGVRIWDESDTLFRLDSVKLPSDEGLPYRVKCAAFFELEEMPQFSGQPTLTRVHWTLDLDILMDLPRFLQALPQTMVKNVGSNVINRVTRSMSDRLTHNVCNDFYRSIGKPGQRYRLVHTSALPGDGC